VLILGSLLFNILTSEDNLDGTLCSHDGDLSGEQGIFVVSVKMLGVHHIVGAIIDLSSDEVDLRDGSLSESAEKLSTMLDNTSELLNSSGKESWDISEGDNMNLESITEADETCSLD
jgi:hypothetical protein